MLIPRQKIKQDQREENSSEDDDSVDDDFYLEGLNETTMMLLKLKKPNTFINKNLGYLSPSKTYVKLISKDKKSKWSNRMLYTEAKDGSLISHPSFPVRLIKDQIRMVSTHSQGVHISLICR